MAIFKRSNNTTYPKKQDTSRQRESDSFSSMAEAFKDYQRHESKEIQELKSRKSTALQNAKLFKNDKKKYNSFTKLANNIQEDIDKIINNESKSTINNTKYSNKKVLDVDELATRLNPDYEPGEEKKHGIDIDKIIRSPFNFNEHNNEYKLGCLERVENYVKKEHNSKQSKEIALFIDIFLEQGFMKIDKVNTFITKNHLWDQFKEIRALNEYNNEGYETKGIKRHVYGIIAELLDLGFHISSSLTKQKSY